MKVDWKKADMSNSVPEKTRKEIAEAVEQEFSGDLLAARMVNIWLEGVNAGLSIANAEMNRAQRAQRVASVGRIYEPKK